jgi:hypothetical protein
MIIFGDGGGPATPALLCRLEVEFVMIAKDLD